MDFQTFGKWHSTSLGISSDLLHKKYHLFQNDNRICSECCIDIDGIFYIQTIGLSSVPNLILRIKILLKTWWNKLSPYLKNGLCEGELRT